MTDEPRKKRAKRPPITDAQFEELLKAIGPPPDMPFVPTYDRDGKSDWTPNWDTREVPGRGDEARGQESPHEGGDLRDHDGYGLRGHDHEHGGQGAAGRDHGHGLDPGAGLGGGGDDHDGDHDDHDGDDDGGRRPGGGDGTSAKTPKPRRRRSGTARWHMSRKAVDLSLAEVYRMTDHDAQDLLVRARWGSWDLVRCPHCGTIHRHYWKAYEERWKCAGCARSFSVTSGTVFAHRKLAPRQLIANTLLWINSAAGQPALELKRHSDTSYNTVFVQQHKLREALVRGYNEGLLSGDVEMDGAHQAGRYADVKRGRPQGTKGIPADAPVEELNEILVSGPGRGKGKKAAVGAFPKDRRFFITVRQRSGRRGQGAVATRVAIGLAEDSKVAKSVMDAYLAVPESTLNTDTSPAYLALGRGFRKHRTVEHGAMVVGPDGENNNQAEELNWRMDRAEQGVYLNLEPKYLMDYGCEAAFRSDTRRLPNGRQLLVALNVAMAVGTSLFWVGYTHGRHRKVELLHPAPAAARASGPPKGRHPIRGSGRPPR